MVQNDDPTADINTTKQPQDGDEHDDDNDNIISCQADDLSSKGGEAQVTREGKGKPISIR